MRGFLIAFALWPIVVLGHGVASPGSPSERRIEFPDTEEFRTLSVDLHTHSVFSDGHVWPRIRVAEALRDGLDGLAITEHLEWQPHRADIANPDRNRAFEAAAESLGEADLILIPGVEITRDAPAGHMNAVFITDANALFEAPDALPATSDPRTYYREAGRWPAQQALERANDQGAFVFWNHAWWTRAFPDEIVRLDEFHRSNAQRGLLHGMEIANGNAYSAHAFQIALDHDLTLLGVSDVHQLIDWDYPPAEGAHRPVTLVLAHERSGAAIREALFARRTLVWFKNLLIARPAEMQALLRACLAVTDARYRAGTQLLRVTLQNRSDARFELTNRSPYTFSETADRVVVPPHGTTVLHVRTGSVIERVTLAFEVENALTAPGVHPALELEAEVAARVPPASSRRNFPPEDGGLQIASSCSRPSASNNGRPAACLPARNPNTMPGAIVPPGPP